MEARRVKLGAATYPLLSPSVAHLESGGGYHGGRLGPCGHRVSQMGGIERNSQWEMGGSGGGNNGGGGGSWGRRTVGGGKRLVGFILSNLAGGIGRRHMGHVPKNSMLVLGTYLPT